MDVTREELDKVLAVWDGNTPIRFIDHEPEFTTDDGKTCVAGSYIEVTTHEGDIKLFGPTGEGVGELVDAPVEDPNSPENQTFVDDYNRQCFSAED